MDSLDEIICICDDQSWIWNFITTNLTNLKRKHVRLSSSIIIRKSWNRIKKTPLIVVYWENVERSAGAILEEILEVDSNFNIAERVIVVTSNPQHEDVVYFSELGVKRIVRLTLRAKSLKDSAVELARHVVGKTPTSETDKQWSRLLRVLSHCTAKTTEAQLNKLDRAINAMAERAGQKDNAIYLDAMATIENLRGNEEKAVGFWQRALEVNPNYYRTYNNLIKFFQQTKQFQLALDLIKKMQALNKNSVSRAVQIGQVHSMMNQDDKAEHYFSLALNKDKYCSSALNGLAEIRFRQDNLEDARSLLARSNIAYKTASYLNQIGIELVRQKKYKAALIHYSKAQFVLPQQSKGPMLFYNIGLCYSKWGKPAMAIEFLKIALIKEPKYKKAQNLLNTVTTRRNYSRAS
jgi:pentatricopeptide repeat protein